MTAVSKNRFELVCLEWLNGCAHSTKQTPWDCSECTRSFIGQLLHLRDTIPKTGCGSVLKKGQWFRFCGETDMGQTAPALCAYCGGEYFLGETK